MIKKFLILFLTTIFLSGFVLFPVYSQSVDDLEGELDKKNQEVKEKESDLDRIKREIENIKNSTESLDSKLLLIEKELNNVTNYVNSYRTSLSKKEKELKQKEAVVNLGKKQLSEISYLLYKTSRLGFLDYFFLNDKSSEAFKDIFYKQYMLSKYIQAFKDKRQEYAQINSQRIKLDSEKKELEGQLKELDKLKENIVAQKNEYQGLIVSKSSQSSALKKQIGLLKEDISDLQVAILVAKSGSASINAGDVPASGSGSLSAFQSSANSGDFGVFSFGAFTHRNGMSQWAVRARADAGQTYEQILKAYYPGKVLRTGTVVIGSKTKNIMTTIKTTTGETLDFENEYLMRLGEMPESWDLDALKAQAIAARTYAVNYTQNGANPICITQSCQVILPNKKTGAWKTAVNQTKGIILTSGSGVPFSAQYAAVHGGWVNGIGWDTEDKKGPPNAWVTKAWDNKSGVSWFYQAWNVFTPGMGACPAHSKPWLTTSEMVDLLNTYLVLKNDGVVGSVNSAKILPETLGTCKISGLSGSPYTKAQMAALLSSPVTSISNPTVVTQGSNGMTSSIVFKTNRGNISVSGEDFKQVFNMRAPGYLSIPQNNFVFIDVIRK